MTIAATITTEECQKPCEVWRGISNGKVMIRNINTTTAKPPLVISSNLPEALQLSDWNCGMHTGAIIEAFDRGAAKEETIMYAAVH